jgi:peroxiredoxin
MSPLMVGDAAVDFTLPGTDNQHHALADYADQTALVLIFSCNHCPYVRAWEDRMNMIQREYAGRGAQVLAINANDAQKYPDDSFEKMQQRANEKQFAFPYLYDESQETARAYGAQRTPEVFLFDAARTLRYHGAIDDNYESADAVRQHYLRDALDAVLAGQAPALTDTPPVGCTIKWR